MSQIFAVMQNCKLHKHILTKKKLFGISIFGISAVFGILTSANMSNVNSYIKYVYFNKNCLCHIKLRKQHHIFHYVLVLFKLLSFLGISRILFLMYLTITL